MALGYAPKRRYKGMGLLRLGEGIPRRTQGVEQRVAYMEPLRCDKCGSAAVFRDRTEARRLWCHGCSSDWFLIRP